jgi:multidrug efflux pump subunit AcrA (membrane-fusion protein)
MIGSRPVGRRAPSWFVIAALVGISATACSKKQGPPPRPVAMVNVVPARRATVPYIIESNGIVTPLQTVSVLPQVDGIIQSVDFQEGQEVGKGQSLFHIDARPYQNAYDQAVATLARDSATWENAKANSDRYQELLKQRVITFLETEAQVTGEASARAVMQADRANIAQAKFNLENTVIRAPIGGRTGNVLVRLGNLVHSAGGTPLVVINQVRPILVRFAIPSAQLPMVVQYGGGGGLAVEAVPGGVAPPTPSIDSLAAEAMNPVGDSPSQDGGGFGGGGGGGNGGSGRGHRGAGGGARNGDPTSGGASGSGGPPNGGAGTDGLGAGAVPQGHSGAAAQGGGGYGSGAAISAATGPATPVGERLTGKLSFIDNAIDTSTQTVQLKATFDNRDGHLWAGEFTATSLHLFDEDSALVVPAQAVVSGQRGMYVYVVDPSDTARQRGVIVERTQNGLSVISSGIHEGDRVVTDGQSRLTPDAPVRIRGPNDVTAGGSSGGRRGGGRGGRGGRRNGGGGAAGADSTAAKRGG